MFSIEHSVPSFHGTLTDLEPMREGQISMRNARHHISEKERNSANQFNDSEYKRWSEGISTGQSLKTQWGIESFLGTNEKLDPGSEDISLSSMEVGEK